MRLVYRQSALPSMNSEFMDGLARRLWEMKEYYHYARRPLEDVWRQCDDAYLCYRELPENDGMVWADNSDFGSTAILDGVNNLSTRLTLAMMPKDESWLTVVGRSEEDAAIVQAVQAQQIWMHRKARTRRAFAKHLKQLIIRGTSAIFWHWEDVTRWKALGTAEGRRKLKSFLKSSGVSPQDIRLFGKVRTPETVFAGPRIRVLDVYDLFMDPAADLSVDRNPATIVQTYRRLSDLKAEQDMEGNPIYNPKVLDSIVPTETADIYIQDTTGAQRLRSLNTMGVFPQNQAYHAPDLVPVYIAYMPYFQHEGEEFYDTYFHFAVSAEGKTVKMLRVEESLSTDGHRFILVDTMIDWFGNTAYGISPVEKLISLLKQLNVLEALTLNSALVTTFPAYNVMSGAIRDESGISFAAGAVNEIAFNALGLDFIKPMPVPERGLQLGMQDSRFWGQKIADSLGAQGVVNDDPTRSISTRETATSVNVRATSGNIAIDEQAEKFGDTLQELCQGVFDMARQMLMPDENGDLEFGEITGSNQIQAKKIKFDMFDQPRDIEILGLHGVVNRAKEIEELREALAVVGQIAPALPNAPMLAQSIALQLINKLNVKVPDEAKMSPQELAAMDPQVQMMALETLMQQNPQIAAMLQGGMSGQQQPPQGQGPPQR